MRFSSQARRLGAIAFTDHDTIDGVKTYVESSGSEDIHVLPGVADIHVAYQLRRYPVPLQRVGLIEHGNPVETRHEEPTEPGRPAQSIEHG